MPHKNLLLDRLPREVYDRISPDLEKVVMTQGQILHRKGEPIKELYFPLTCMISITIMMKDGRTVETGAIGSREVVGINAFMGGRETTDGVHRPVTWRRHGDSSRSAENRVQPQY